MTKKSPRRFQLTLLVPCLGLVLLAVAAIRFAPQVLSSSRSPGVVAGIRSDSIMTYETTTGEAVDTTQVSTAGPVPAAVNQLYVASVSLKPDVAVRAVEGLGLIWKRAAAQCGGRAQTRTELWYAFGSPAAAGKVTVQLGDKAPKAAVVAVTRYGNVDGSEPVLSTAAANSRGVTDSRCSGGTDADRYSLRVPTAAGVLVHAAVSVRHYGHTPGTGVVELVQKTTARGGGDDAGLAVVQIPAAGGPETTLSGSTSREVDYAVAAIAIQGEGTAHPDPSVTPVPTRVLTPSPVARASATPTGTPRPTAIRTPSPTVLRTPTPTAVSHPGGSPTPTPTRGPIGITPPVDESDPRITCSKYSQRRIFLETQAWWMNTKSISTPSQIPLDGIGGHTHTATCFPQDELVTGTLDFDVRLMLHKGNVGAVHWLDVGVGPGGGSIARVSFRTPITCPGGQDPKVGCEVWVPISVDTSKIPAGYQELRFRFNVEQPNGERQFASTGWQAYFHSRTGGFRTPTWIEARGWYTNANYANARFLSPVPHAPVSGVWTFSVAMVPGAGGVRVTHSAVHVDAKFNLDDFGTTIMETDGQFKGTVSIDTTRLANGRHYLAIKTDQTLGNGGTNTGILQLPFFVRN